MGKRIDCPLGPRVRGREGGPGSPRVLVPLLQAPQAVLARPGPPGSAPPGLQPLGWDEGPHFPEESKTRPGPDPEP